jgi:hypothetical protein
MDEGKVEMMMSQWGGGRIEAAIDGETALTSSPPVRLKSESQNGMLKQTIITEGT